MGIYLVSLGGIGTGVLVWLSTELYIHNHWVLTEVFRIPAGVDDFSIFPKKKDCQFLRYGSPVNNQLSCLKQPVFTGRHITIFSVTPTVID